ncbi:MAG TPA: TolC family protein, partial [Puia sp.]|nr:TolC family protein [Puia sp.]
TNFPFKIPIPGFSLPSYSKDQNKAYAELDQTLYDGGTIKNQKLSAILSENIDQQNLEVELFALYDRVNQLFFGALLIDEQLKENELLKTDIRNGLEKVQAQVANGVAYRSNADELSAQLLQADQSRDELMANRQAYLDMLGLFLNRSLDSNTILARPTVPNLVDSIARPELALYDYQARNFDVQDQMISSQLKPRLSLFIQGGYARPGLNFLSNSFQWYYIGGVRLNWNLGSLYTTKNQRQMVNINRKMTEIQKETFVFNIQITRQQQQSDFNKYAKLIQKDDEIIALRQAIKNAASAQLQNGVLGAHDYITQVDAEDQARQNMILHEIQLLQTQYNYQNTTGNIAIH